MAQKTDLKNPSGFFCARNVICSLWAGKGGTMKKIILFVVIIVITMTMPVYGAEVPKLNKEEATKIMEYMGYTDVVVGFVIDGVLGPTSGYGGDYVAFVKGEGMVKSG